LYHSILGWRVIKKKRREEEALRWPEGTEEGGDLVVAPRKGS